MQRTLQTILIGGLLASVVASTATAAERISLKDIDLSSPRGAAVFKTKVDAAARRVCRVEGRQSLSSAAECRQAAWDEVTGQLSVDQRHAYAVASTGKPVQVAVASGW